LAVNKSHGAIVIDPISGEVTGKVIRIKKQVLQKEKDFYMADQRATLKLAKDKELWGQTRAVLDYMLSQLNFDNAVPIVQKTIAKELDIDTSRVSLSIKKLLNKKIIKRDEKSGLKGMYLLNIEYFWKGKRNKNEN
jgi:DNA-binding transcriptional regulator GbsR (MarR family)